MGREESIIISSTVGREELPPSVLVHQEQMIPAEQEETLREFQNKVRKTCNPAKTKRSRNNPILRGTSSKKRKLSQVQNSPKGGRGAGEGTSRVNQKRKMKNDPKALSQGTGNPPIQLIPAMTRKEADFRVTPPRAP